MDYVATLSARNKSRSRSRYLATLTLSLKLMGLQSWIRDQPNCVSSSLKYLGTLSFVRQKIFGMRKISYYRTIAGITAQLFRVQVMSSLRLQIIL